MKRISFRLAGIAASLLALSMLSACVAPAYQTTYRYPYQPAGYPVAGTPVPYVEYGRIANIEVLRTQTTGGTSGAGAVTGGVIGGVLGHQVGGGSGRAAATALGVVGGALLGNAIESNASAPQVVDTYRISIQTDNGGYRAFDVPNPGDLRVGDRVRINNGQISRM